jgi:hypothetical protein
MKYPYMQYELVQNRGTFDIIEAPWGAHSMITLYSSDKGFIAQLQSVTNMNTTSLPCLE